MRWFITQFVRLLFLCALAPLMMAASAQAVVLEGVGHASIHNDDLASARAEARNAAMRDLALQYEAQVSTSDTMENGVLTESSMRLASSARARNVKVIDEHRSGNLLRVTVRGDISAGSASCGGAESGRLKKRVAVTGFPILYPDQARVGRIDDAGEILPQHLQQGLRESGNLQVFSATTSRLFPDLLNAPTIQKNDNRLTNVIQLAREMGVQFVVTGVIRDIGVADPAAWGSSVLDRMQRSIGAADMRRRFAVDVVVLDGFSGSPIYQQRFETAADWNAGPGSSSGFGSEGFRKTQYGEAVAGVVGDMAQVVTDALACQPFMARVTRVDGQLVTLDSGATAGLRPGDELHLYRSARYFDSLGGTPELSDSQINVTLNNVHPDFSNGRMPQVGGQVNIQRDDIAIIW
ncbi:flagellar assembly protein T N-terminal domain-containing protein [Marinobacter sp. 2_MG-2023]|uniref:flagellar assembly protein T N-terminal domain-containing protein n=1 Tax=Marinobacter sp. 2_MG-2023 TaxID=3062679 RepID=UPI0026E3C75B|nr:flagellar assembly protein T N-terminal domain-containing protein [Marinobacter sp. 2_MG-2023]MDO6443070.1 flagellar assembly protein T N-terminal domain-containing protein [Marinobacter sp. 2_MG-2023]